ncbi:MAG: NAD(P)-binding protein, partial [Rhodobacteraceae bacterium]|nr:NAD(P)-binding protein [Paracoccaceae bacterium]
MSQDPVIIAGGGIGGLATAIGLARKGIASVVLEKAPQLGE